MNPSDPIAALEIGTTRTVIAIAEPLGEGRIRVAAYDGIPSSGVRKSQIVDIAQARYSVASVQKKLVTQSDYAVAQAYLVVSGQTPSTIGTPTIFAGSSVTCAILTRFQV